MKDNNLLRKIKKCTLCKEFLPLEPRPIVQFTRKARILLIGQAPGVKAHNSNTPWDDKSGERLREWLAVNKEQFYDPNLFAIVPMAFCYPGKGKSGDLPPRKECAAEWMEPIRKYLINIELEIYIGKYACDYYFGKGHKLTDLVKDQYKNKDNRIVLPHPSPRNNIWLAKNEWFEKDALKIIRKKCQKYL